MTLPSSGQLSLSMIKTEFAGGNAMSGYYKGGAYVPNTAANANIPTSGQLKISNFYGGSADTTVIALTDKYITAELSGVAAYAGFRMASGGKLRARQGNSLSTYDEIPPYNEWADPEETGVGSLYECYAYVATGSTPSGPLGAWTALNTAPTWEFIRSTVGTSSCTLTILVRRIGTTTTLASANIYLTATQNAAFSPVTRTYTTPGTYVETAPAGCSNVVIAVWGGGGGGWPGDGVIGGDGGDGGGYSESTYAISGGLTLNFSVGGGGTGGPRPSGTPTAGGISSVSSGSKTITTISCATVTASGGNTTNTVGNYGGFSSGINGGTGGPAVVGFGGNAYGAGGNGGGRFGAGANGAVGGVIFYYT